MTVDLTNEPEARAFLRLLGRRSPKPQPHELELQFGRAITQSHYEDDQLHALARRLLRAMALEKREGQARLLAGMYSIAIDFDASLADADAQDGADKDPAKVAAAASGC